MKYFGYLFLPSLLLMMMVWQKSPATTYYISPSGSHTNSGTSPQAAWRTIAKVNATDFNPGDKVLFEAGREFHGNLLLTAEDAGTPKHPVVISSYGSGRATIKAGDGSGVTVCNVGGVVIENLIVMGNDYKTNIGNGITIVNELPNNEKREYIRVHNVEAAGFGRHGIFVGGWASDESKSGLKDVRITNCVTYQNKRGGILTIGYWQDDPNISDYANSNVYVGYCKAYDNPGDPEYHESHSGNGILMADVDGGMIEYCEAYNNGYDCGSRAGGPVGIWACGANNVIIQHCESHHNRTGGRWDGGGFDFDGGTTNSVMQYNYSHDNDGAGYLICSYKDAPHTYNNNIFRYNISVNDSQKETKGGISLWTGSPKDHPIRNTQIYGNTIYSSSSEAIFVSGTKGIYNTKVCNNLFITANNQKFVHWNPDKSMATFAGNAYWAVDGKYNIAGYKSLEDWRKATGQEMLDGNPVGLFVDPKLMDLGKSITVGDPTKFHTLTAYQLQKNSPLIDAGLDLRLLFGIDPGKRDFFGNSIPQGKAYDIGAHEFISDKAIATRQIERTKP